MSGLQLMGSGRAGRVRRRYDVFGLVQGVGFRPFVYVTAAELGLTGSVSNTAAGVVVEVEGDPDAVDAFGRRLRDDAPPLAEVEGVHESELAARGGTGFTIEALRAADPAGPWPPPTSRPATTASPSCADPTDRRYRHPFITLHQLRSPVHDHHGAALRPGHHHDGRVRDVRRLPRGVRRPGATVASTPSRSPATTAVRRSSSSRPACTRPGDDAVRRRARAARGRTDRRRQGARRLPPRLRRAERAGRRRAAAAQAARRQAVRGDGARPRRRAAAGVAVATPSALLLTGIRRPVVLLPRAESRCGWPNGRSVAEAVAPGNPDLGVMLPYTPLHVLLLGEAGDPRPRRAGDDVGQPVRRADRHRRRGGAHPARRHRRRVAAARPADPRVLRRLGRPRRRRGRAAGPAVPRVRAAAGRPAVRGRRRCSRRAPT